MSFWCDLGFHEWKRVYSSSDSCKVQDRCSRCGEVKEQDIVLHKWEWVERNPCLREQVCKRCGVTGQVDIKEHHWRTNYEPNSYDIHETCENCGTARTRPSAFSTFVGQDEIKPSLVTLLAAAIQKGEPLHHLLLCANNGMGKLTIAKIMAAEMGVNTKITSGRAIGKVEHLAAILTDLRAGDFLIIEQIESMREQTLEVLIDAMTDFSFEIVIGKGPSARNIKLKLPRFTAVCTTSKPQQLDQRLGSLMFVFNFAPYEEVEVGKIISLLAAQQGINIEMEATTLLAEQSNGCPGEALLVLKKVHKYAIAYSDGQITSTIAREALDVFGSKKNSPSRNRQPISDDVKMYVWKRDGGRCIKCGSQENLEYDHIIPVSKGGSNTARNIQLLCEECNRSKGANIV